MDALPPLSAMMPLFFGLGVAAAALVVYALSRQAAPRTKRVLLASVGDLAVGKMKDCKVVGPDNKPVTVLLVRTSKNKFKATGSKCT